MTSYNFNLCDISFGCNISSRISFFFFFNFILLFSLVTLAEGFKIVFSFQKNKQYFLLFVSFIHALVYAL